MSASFLFCRYSVLSPSYIFFRDVSLQYTTLCCCRPCLLMMLCWKKSIRMATRSLLERHHILACLVVCFSLPYTLYFYLQFSLQCLLKVELRAVIQKRRSFLPRQKRRKYQQAAYILHASLFINTHSHMQYGLLCSFGIIYGTVGEKKTWETKCESLLYLHYFFCRGTDVMRRLGFFSWLFSSCLCYSVDFSEERSGRRLTFQGCTFSVVLPPNKRMRKGECRKIKTLFESSPVHNFFW